MRCRALVLVLLFCIPGMRPLYAQTSNSIDSLKLEIEKLPNDSAKVDQLVGLVIQYMSINSEQSIEFGLQVLAISDTLPYELAMARAYNYIGLNFLNQSDHKKAIEYFELCRILTTRMNFLPGKGAALQNLGVVYFRLEEYGKSIGFYLKNMDIQKQSGNDLGVADMLNNIGSVHFTSEKFDTALVYYKQALAIHKRLEDKWNSARSLGNIAQTYLELENVDSAMENALASLKLREAIEDKAEISLANSALGYIYIRNKEFHRAIHVLSKSLNYEQDAQNKTQLSIVRNYLGSAYNGLGKYDLAVENSTKALQIAREITDPKLQKNALKELSETYSASSQFRKSYEFLNQYSELADSVHDEKIRTLLDLMQVGIDLEKEMLTDSLESEKILALKQAEVKRQQTFTYFGLAGFLLMMILAGNIYMGLRRKRKDNEIIAEEKEKSDRLLLNILPEETAEELKLFGAATARDYESVSVLFTDFKGFTMVAEKLSPADLVAQIDYCFIGFDKIIDKYGIEKIKTIGDAYMCAGGLPQEDSENPVKVANAALEIRDFMLEYKRKREERNQIAFEIRIGIHTGPVVAGVVGIKKFAYDIWGDAVNTAARMESSGEVGKVNVSGSTYELIKNEFDCTYRGKIAAKNKGEIDMYFVEPKSGS